MTLSKQKFENGDDVTRSHFLLFGRRIRTCNKAWNEEKLLVLKVQFGAKGSNPQTNRSPSLGEPRHMEGISTHLILMHLATIKICYPIVDCRHHVSEQFYL